MWLVSRCPSFGQGMHAIHLCARRSSQLIRQVDFGSRIGGRTGQVHSGARQAVRNKWFCSIGISSSSLAPPLNVSGTTMPFSTWTRITSSISAPITSVSSHDSFPTNRCLGSIRSLAIKSSKRTVALTKKLEEQQAKQNKTLLNDQLVTAILQNTNKNFASDVQVRVSPDPLESREEGETKKESQVMTLDEAIQIAVKEQKDLIEIAIQQDIPVLTISSWESLQYKAEKLSKQRRRNASAAQVGASILKEITFKVGIADHDLQRKVDEMIKFLSKGHNCQISVRATKRYALKDPASAREMADRVVDLMEDNGGELVRDVVMNEGQTEAKFLIRPRKL